MLMLQNARAKMQEENKKRQFQDNSSNSCNAPFQIHIRLANPNLIWGVMLLITLNLEL